MIKRQQTELGLKQANAFRSPEYRQRRLGRARWWFTQMHRVVEQARDWKAVPPTHAEQIALPLAGSHS